MQAGDRLDEAVHGEGQRAVTLTEAGSLLGLAPATLRRQLNNGVIRGKKVGKTWTITPKELEKYRTEHMGRKGRRPATK